MKLRVFEGKEDEEKTVYLKLKQGVDSVAVVACDMNGETVEGGDILRITKDGRIVRYRFVSPKLGFDLDEVGRVRWGEFQGIVPEVSRYLLREND